MEIFQFLTDEMLQCIADETNDYSANHPWQVRLVHRGDWFAIAVNKTKVLLALLILVGIMKKPFLASYWNWDPAA